MDTNTYTGFIRFEFCVEEIDVTASSFEEAERLIQAELDADYEPGGVIAHIEKRPNGFLFL